MEIRTTKGIEPIVTAMRRTQEDFEWNLAWKRPPEWLRTGRDGRNVFRCTLTVKDSKGPGGRYGMNGRRVHAACWHVFGTFFDYVWESDPQAVIMSMGTKMEGPEDNWQDRNIGSMMSPLFYSDACDCE